MSWSDDIRCLYCDGRLPLYRKITHGQFCSSAHRKAYWQEQERLAVERLHQTHDSLAAQRDLVPDAVPGGVVPADLCIPPAPRAIVQEPEDWRIPELAGPDPAPADPAPAEVAPADVPPAVYDFGWSPHEPGADLHVDANVDTNVDTHVDPPWAGSVAMALNGAAAQWSRGLDWDSEPLALLSEFPLAPLVEFVPATAEPAAEVREVEPDAPFEDRMYPLALGLAQPPAESSYAPAGLDSIARGLGALCQALEFPQTAAAVTGLEGPRFNASHASLTGAGLVPVGVATPLAPSRKYVKPVAQRVECLDVPAATVSAPRLSAAGSQPALLLGTPSAYTTRPGASSPAVSSKAPRRAVTEQAFPPAYPALVDSGLDASVLSGSGVGARNPALLPSESLQPLRFDPVQAHQDQSSRFASAARPGSIAALYSLPQPSDVPVVLPQSGCEPLDTKPVTDEFPDGAADLGRPAALAAAGANPFQGGAGPIAQPVATLKHVTGFWKHAPRDLRLLLIAIPALIALVFHPSLPKVSVRAPQGNPIGGMLGSQFANVRQSLMDRAAVALDEDFRAGLDGWVSRGNATAAWSFDATGFVQPGPLALYQPSMGLSDYQLQFLGMIDQKALSWVVRAADFENYYVVKLVVLKPGPLPEIGVTRYAVINGKADARADVVVPISARPDMLYRVRMDINGDDFLLEVQGQVVDNWTEPRLRRGGMGFFSARGEQSRVRWVQVTHQYDMLGRLCAYLAPYNIPSNGSW